MDERQKIPGMGSELGDKHADVAPESETPDLPVEGMTYRLSFVSKMHDGRLEMKAKYKIPKTKQTFLIIPARWQPKPNIEYEVRLITAANRGDGKNYHGLWLCRPVDQQRDEAK